jgi:hypothetical protein
MRDRRSASSSKLPIILGSSLLLAAVIVVAVIVVTRSKNKQKPSDAPDASKITMENFDKVKSGHGIDEVRSILGSGSPSSENELRGEFDKAGKVNGALEMAGAKFSPAEKWYVWRGNDLTIFIGFGNSASGDRVAYSAWLRKSGNGYEAGHGVQLLRDAKLDTIAKKRGEQDSLLNDPKWKTGQEAVRLLIGEWRQPDAKGWRFFADGSCDFLPSSEHVAVTKGTFRFSSDRKLDLIYQDFVDPSHRGPTHHACTLLIAGDELILLREPTKDRVTDGPYYRLNPAGSGLGKTKVLDPMLQRLNSMKPEERAEAGRLIGLLGPSAALLVPEMTKLLKQGDEGVGLIVMRLLVGVGPASRDAVPALIDLLRKPPYTTYHQEICSVLGAMGANASEALPVLRDLQTKPEVPGIVKIVAERSVRQIQKK